MPDRPSTRSSRTSSFSTIGKTATAMSSNSAASCRRCPTPNTPSQQGARLRQPGLAVDATRRSATANRCCISSATATRSSCAGSSPSPSRFSTARRPQEILRHRRGGGVRPTRSARPPDGAALQRPALTGRPHQGGCGGRCRRTRTSVDRRPVILRAPVARRFSTRTASCALRQAIGGGQAQPVPDAAQPLPNASAGNDARASPRRAYDHRGRPLKSIEGNAEGSFVAPAYRARPPHAVWPYGQIEMIRHARQLTAQQLRTAQREILDGAIEHRPSCW